MICWLLEIVPDFEIENVKLVLVITENIATVSNSKLKNPIVSPSSKYVPTSSVMNPLGTVLYGTNASVIEAKRMKLKIY